MSRVSKQSYPSASLTVNDIARWVVKLLTKKQSGQKQKTGNYSTEDSHGEEVHCDLCNYFAIN